MLCSERFPEKLWVPFSDPKKQLETNQNTSSANTKNAGALVSLKTSDNFLWGPRFRRPLKGEDGEQRASYITVGGCIYVNIYIYNDDNNNNNNNDNNNNNNQSYRKLKVR